MFLEGATLDPVTVTNFLNAAGVLGGMVLVIIALVSGKGIVLKREVTTERDARVKCEADRDWWRDRYLDVMELARTNADTAEHALSVATRTQDRRSGAGKP